MTCCKIIKILWYVRIPAPVFTGMATKKRCPIRQQFQDWLENAVIFLAKHPIYFRCRSQNGKKNREKMAEGKGFEPPKGISSFNDLANRRLQPLGHPPAGVTGPAGKFLASAHVHNTRRMLPFL